MGVTVSWYDDEQTIIIYEFDGTWTWNEYDEARLECRRMLDTVDFGVDQIYDFSNAPVPPKGVVAKFWQAAVTKHRNSSGLIVGVGSNKLIAMLANTVTGLVRRATSDIDVTYLADRSKLDEHIAQRRAIHRGS